ncbi:MAG: HEAT repeat domain-containing protein [Anaerolineae bacterium]
MRKEQEALMASAWDQIGDSQSMGPLIAVFKDKARDVRGSAVRVLGQIGDTHAVEPILAAWNDGEGRLRRAAARAPRRLPTREAQAALEEVRLRDAPTEDGFARVC